MDDIFLCPDCHAEHRQPVDAGLGHVARCLDCTLAVALAAEHHPKPKRGRNLHPIAALTLEIRVAA